MRCCFVDWIKETFWRNALLYRAVTVAMLRCVLVLGFVTTLCFYVGVYPHDVLRST